MIYGELAKKLWRSLGLGDRQKDRRGENAGHSKNSFYSYRDNGSDNTGGKSLGTVASVRLANYQIIVRDPRR